MTNFFFHESAIIDEGAQVGTGTKVWHFSHIMSTAFIGQNCTIGQNVFVGQNVRVGNNVKIQNNVSLYEGVVCEGSVFIGPNAVFTNVINPRSEVNRRLEFKNTLIKQGASIGANATIICGNIIGKYAFVGAGAVVTKSILDYSIVVGNPAKHIGWMSAYGEELLFNEWGEAICKATKTKYLLSSKGEVTSTEI